MSLSHVELRKRKKKGEERIGRNKPLKSHSLYPLLSNILLLQGYNYPRKYVMPYLFLYIIYISINK
jgi:hypothetical protein